MNEVLHLEPRSGFDIVGDVVLGTELLLLDLTVGGENLVRVGRRELIRQGSLLAWEPQ